MDYNWDTDKKVSQFYNIKTKMRNLKDKIEKKVSITDFTIFSTIFWIIYSLLGKHLYNASMIGINFSDWFLSKIENGRSITPYISSIAYDTYLEYVLAWIVITLLLLIASQIVEYIRWKYDKVSLVWPLFSFLVAFWIYSYYLWENPRERMETHDTIWFIILIAYIPLQFYLWKSLKGTSKIWYYVWVWVSIVLFVLAWLEMHWYLFEVLKYLGVYN